MRPRRSPLASRLADFRTGPLEPVPHRLPAEPQTIGGRPLRQAIVLGLDDLGVSARRAAPVWPRDARSIRPARRATPGVGVDGLNRRRGGPTSRPTTRVDARASYRGSGKRRRRREPVRLLQPPTSWARQDRGPRLAALVFDVAVWERLDGSRAEGHCEGASASTVGPKSLKHSPHRIGNVNRMHRRPQVSRSNAVTRRARRPGIVTEAPHGASRLTEAGGREDIRSLPVPRGAAERRTHDG